MDLSGKIKRELWLAYHHDNWGKYNWIELLEWYKHALNDNYKRDLRQQSMFGPPEDAEGNKLKIEDIFV